MKLTMLWRAFLPGLVVGLQSLAWAESPATVDPCAEAGIGTRPVLSARLDNDLFGGSNQDRGYTNGFQLTLKSGNLDDFANQDCLPLIARGINRYLEWLQPKGFDKKNVVLGLGQSLYTPSVRTPVGVQLRDRPYAAVLLASIGYNARSGDTLQSSLLRVGMVGPSAQGEAVQNNWHRIFGIDPWQGWDTQLRDEPVLQVVHERVRRWQPERAGAWEWDANGHWGGSLGNLVTAANIGLEVRLGRRLPDDFGSDPLRPGGENTAPVHRAPSPDRWAWHVFASIDVRAVAHNLTLDGNTWKSSHSVDKRVLVSDFGRGIALAHGPWKIAFAHYNRSREFAGQEELPVFGSFTISRGL